MQILELVLYGKNKKLRKIRFKENSTNIIYSNHNTGKSSVIDIIEYCLGQSTNHINSTLARELVAWFGITINLNGKKFFIARPNIEDQVSTDLMYLESVQDTCPNEPPLTHNIHRKKLLNFLSKELKISEIPLEYKNDEYFTTSIRHALFFCYLTQHEISTTDLLFHRSYDGFINLQRELSLEYFLDSFEEDIFLNYIEIKKLNQKLGKIMTKLKEYELIKGNVFERASEFIGKCEKYGISDETEIPEDLTEYIGVLKRIIRKWKPEEIPIMKDEIDSLYDQIFELKENLRNKTEMLSDLKKYSNIATDFQEKSYIQKYRLKLADVFNTDNINPTCPLCQNDLDGKIPKRLEQIKKDFGEIDKNLRNTTKVTHYVGEFIEKAEDDKNKITTKIDKLSAIIKGFIYEQSSSKKIFEDNIRISETIGQIKLWLSSVEETDEQSKLGMEKKRIDIQLKNLREIINRTKEGYHRQTILDSINSTLSLWAKELKIQDAEKFQIDFTVDTIKLLYNSGKILNYSNLGGGHNMLCIHLILYLGLHKYFSENERPVPNFLILDQPSTAYFPRDPETNNIDDYVKGNERQTLENIYKFIVDKSESLKNFQVILLDQAKFNEDWFDERVVSDWNEGLIPKDWYEH